MGCAARDVHFSDSDRDELLATADESLQRLTRLVENLLDMSRLQAGALALAAQLISIAETVPRAIDDLGEGGRHIELRLPDELPEVLADPVLLERVLVNLLTNALRYSPAGQPAPGRRQRARRQVEIRVVDHGPGVPAMDRDRVFLPFQRLGDRDNATGVGLGLALSRGLVEAMGGTLTPEATPGGGLTMIVALPVAQPEEVAGQDPADGLLERLDHPV